MEMKVQVFLFDLLYTHFHIFHHNTTVTSTSKIPPFNIFILMRLAGKRLFEPWGRRHGCLFTRMPLIETCLLRLV